MDEKAENEIAIDVTGIWFVNRAKIEVRPRKNKDKKLRSIAIHHLHSAAKFTPENCNLDFDFKLEA